MQDDVIFEYFTVREALEFAAKLKLNMPDEDKMVRVDKIIKDLSLQKCANTQIGGLLKKTISGGERKRCAIGVELITDPSMVLLDEPTSGLDSFMAKKICKTLQKLAHNDGKTIIATIH
jgi:ABC-type multidrug transport system ATPase subunit